MIITKTSIKKYLKLADGTHIRVRLRSEPNSDGSYTTKRQIIKAGEWKIVKKIETITTSTTWEDV